MSKLDEFLDKIKDQAQMMVDTTETLPWMENDELNGMVIDAVEIIRLQNEALNKILGCGTVSDTWITMEGTLARECLDEVEKLVENL